MSSDTEAVERARSIMTGLPSGAVLVTSLDQDQLADLRRSLPAGVVQRVLDGIRCPTEGRFFRRIAKALQLPSYFGHNWDALDECLCDRDFEPRAATALIVEHCEHLLQRARQGRRRILFQILN